MWQVLDPRPLPLGTAIWIVDLGGMGLSDLGSDAFQFFKRMSVEVGMHYPERLYKYACLHNLFLYQSNKTANSVSACLLHATHSTCTCSLALEAHGPSLVCLCILVLMQGLQVLGIRQVLQAALKLCMMDSRGT